MSAVKKKITKVAGPARKPVLLERVLDTSASLLLHGAVLPVEPIVAQLRKKLGPLSPLDAREPGQDEAALRAEVAAHLDRSPVLVVLLGAHVSAVVRGVISEVLDGALNTPDGTRKLDDKTRVIALMSGGAPDAATRAMFPMTMAAAAALKPAGSEG